MIRTTVTVALLAVAPVSTLTAIPGDFHLSNVLPSTRTYVSEVLHHGPEYVWNGTVHGVPAQVHYALVRVGIVPTAGPHDGGMRFNPDATLDPSQMHTIDRKGHVID